MLCILPPDNRLRVTTGIDALSYSSAGVIWSGHLVEGATGNKYISNIYSVALVFFVLASMSGKRVCLMYGGGRFRQDSDLVFGGRNTNIK